MKRISGQIHIRCCLLIFLCFLWTSCGYLSWNYQLIGLSAGNFADMASEVAGYLFQAAGLLIFSLLAKRIKGFSGRFSFIAVILADILFMIPAVLLNRLDLILISGYIMNLLHGMVAGFYLDRLVSCTPAGNRGLTFGTGYGLASIASYVISLIGNDNFLKSPYSLIIYVMLAAATVYLVYTEPEASAVTNGATDESDAGSVPFLILSCFTVFLLSLVKNVGFTFPLAELDLGISLEFSRMFYAAGLVIAGAVCDRNRRYAAVCCLASLGVPFLMITLSGNTRPSILIWILNYFLFGFFAVFRVILFSDIAGKSGRLLYVSGWGLLFGRLGDAAGSFTGMVLADSQMTLMVTATMLFTVTVLLFFRLYHKAYARTDIQNPSKEDVFDSFADSYNFSAREREVMTLLLEGCSNTDLSEKLFVSESTVKFHIHNLLKKTGCKDRLALLSLYRRQGSPDQ